ncbi:MAG: Uma2 family endonuclease [Gomphosphaeria aponina SAG 52.96 = DSM 107014]|uniref:Uma2 family endonuclease n=1 Tax=Gomphosphaeria aponina SAG 52.96 = DSM 107014 TaxID=1521640 RepID=A0A941JND1_9CHRO|nr:Uma2 family endonuclease [Gomphosphaeria aponina SAG 52.96 = DSM 107014]
MPHEINQYLAIEVVITSGGIKTLEIYQGLGVPEVWFWQKELLTVYFLQNGEYIQQAKSQLFPNLDLSLLKKYLQYDEPFDAVLDFRNQLRNSLFSI